MYGGDTVEPQLMVHISGFQHLLFNFSVPVAIILLLNYFHYMFSGFNVGIHCGPENSDRFHS
jgi:hypothetical protein